MKTSTTSLSPSDASPAKTNQKASVRRDNGRQPARATTPLAAQRAAAILDVLAGQRTTTEAAAALEISVNHYYLLERRALEGLMTACEPQPKGPPGPTLESQLQKLEQQLQQCRRECLRQAALVRATQRAVGLPAAEGTAKPTRKKNSEPARKKRKPTVRALKAAERLRENSSGSKPVVGLEPGNMNTSKLPCTGLRAGIYASQLVCSAYAKPFSRSTCGRSRMSYVAPGLMWRSSHEVLEFRIGDAADAT